MKQPNILPKKHSGYRLHNHSSCIAHVLLAEDDDDMRTMLATTMKLAGYQVTECTSGLELIEQLNSAQSKGTEAGELFDVVVTDIRKPGLGGILLLDMLAYSAIFTPIVFMTAFPDSETRVKVANLNGVLLEKPFEPALLLSQLTHVLQPRMKAQKALVEAQAAEPFDIIITMKECEFSENGSGFIHHVLHKLADCANNISKVALEFQLMTQTQQLSTYHCCLAIATDVGPVHIEGEFNNEPDSDISHQFIWDTVETACQKLKRLNKTTMTDGSHICQ